MCWPGLFIYVLFCFVLCVLFVLSVLCCVFVLFALFVVLVAFVSFVCVYYCMCVASRAELALLARALRSFRARLILDAFAFTNVYALFYSFYTQF